MEKPIYKKVKINKKWIVEHIEKPGWQRDLYPSRVNYFLKCINDGTFKCSLLTVAKNRKSGRLVLLDGQHKVEAIKQSGKTIEMDISTYKKINENEMIEIYKMLNNVKSQRTIDDIKIHIGRNTYLDLFMSKRYFPINVTLSGGIDSIRVDNFLSVLYNGLNLNISRHGLNRKGMNDFIDKLNKDQFAIMKDFCEFYMNCFGLPSRNNWVYKNTIMFTVMRIWTANKENFTREAMIRAFRPIEMDAGIRQDAIANDVRGIRLVTMGIYELINRGRSANVFKPFWSEENQPTIIPK